MPSYDIFFFGALFFLIGVFLASFGTGFWILVITFAALAVFVFRGSWHRRTRGIVKDTTYFFWLAGLLIFIVIGAVYYSWDDGRFRESVRIQFDKKISFSGVVVSNPVLKSSSQDFKLRLSPPFSGNILVKTSRYPEFRYGDEVKIEGKINEPYSKSYSRYLAKERISGVVTFAKVQKLSSGKGSRIKSFLFSVKNRMTESFQTVLPPQESALLAGLTLGERGEFSKDFKEAMSKSGTTHIVALSGYNITIIVWAVMGLFLWFSVRRRLAFIFTILVIGGFVVMTGAEASVVRAAIMGILVMLAREVGRLYDFRNVIILAGLMMVLDNPKVLVFDIGFQLSFLALLGIIYLKPAIMKFFRISEEKGFLSWRDNLLTTASAQFTVAPLLIANFGNFSLTSLIANVVILELIPVTMGLGFIVAGLSFISYYASFILSWLAQILLKFEILVIEFFAKVSIPFGPTAGFLSFLVYYVVLVGFIIYVNSRKFTFLTFRQYLGSRTSRN